MHYLVCWEDPRKRCTRRYHNHLKKKIPRHFIDDWHFRKKKMYNHHSAYVLRIKSENKVPSCSTWPLLIKEYTQRHWVNTTYLDSQTPKHPLLLASCRRCLLLGHWSCFLEGGYIQLVFGVIPRLRPFRSLLGGGGRAFCSFRWHDFKSKVIIFFFFF